MISEDAKSQNDILDELEKLTDRSITASFTKGSTTEELRAVKIELEKPTKD